MKSLGDGWTHLETYKEDIPGYTREFSGSDFLLDVVGEPDGTMIVRPRGWDNMPLDQQVAIQALLDALPAKVASRAEERKAEDEMLRKERATQGKAIPANTPDGNAADDLECTFDADSLLELGDILATTPSGQDLLAPQAVGNVVLPPLVAAPQ
ncbi:MAG TPA: hypothetical protein VMB52_00115 [Verrucomicrobiae bacterium]|nr:hypothetical protein [Verrucomicrobiae bacterium]